MKIEYDPDPPFDAVLSRNDVAGLEAHASSIALRDLRERVPFESHGLKPSRCRASRGVARAMSDRGPTGGLTRVLGAGVLTWSAAA